jgi:transposase
MTKKSRGKFTGEFQSKGALIALQVRSTMEVLARQQVFHPTQINTWKEKAIAKLDAVFTDSEDIEQQSEKCCAQTKQLQLSRIMVAQRFLRRIGYFLSQNSVLRIP